MISNNRADYSSADEWLSALKQDELWQTQLLQLQNSTSTDASTFRDRALEKIGKGETYGFWDSYNHQVGPVVREVWEIAELSLSKLKIQTIGMLSMEWLEQQATKVIKKPVAKEKAEEPTETSVSPIVQETFADRVKAIIRKAAEKNGQQINANPRGNKVAYLFNINAEAFCKAMDEMVSTYGEKLKDLLGGSLNCLQVTKVCFFIGSVVRMHVINDVNLQTVDMLFAFEGYYDNLQTVKAKLGDKKATSDQNVVLGYFEGILRKYTA